MKVIVFSVRLQCIIALLFSIANASGQLPAIPEPGLLMYGTVTNSNGVVPVAVGNVSWTVAGAGSSARVNSTIAYVGSHYFYVARIPFESRSAGGVNFSPSPNTLPLTGTATQFNRTATVDGTNAIVLAPADTSFPFSKNDRGRVERVNLSVTLPIDPALDTDGDGAPDWAEVVAGTDPNNPLSVFSAESGIEPAAGGGLIIRWASSPGKTYFVYRTKDLDQPFAKLSNAIPANVPENEYLDPSATDAGPYFYRIQVARD